MKKFIIDHFDKILLSGMFMYMIHVVLFIATRQGMAPEVISWARELTSGLVGALLGLITGNVRSAIAAEKDKG